MKLDSKVKAAGRRVKGVTLATSPREHTLYRIDHRTVEGRTMKHVRDALAECVGGSPDIRQALLIERAAWVALRIYLKELKMLEKGVEAMTLHDDLYYLAWVNTLNKILKQLRPPLVEDDTLQYTTILAE